MSIERLDDPGTDPRTVPSRLRLMARMGRDFHGWAGLADELDAMAAQVDRLIHRSDDRRGGRSEFHAHTELPASYRLIPNSPQFEKFIYRGKNIDITVEIAPGYESCVLTYEEMSTLRAIANKDRRAE